MSNARFTAFLLQEVYEGKVRNARLKILNEEKNGGKPFIAPGLRQILDYDHLVGKAGLLPGSIVSSFPLLLAVHLLGHPRHIRMAKPVRAALENWAVIDELTKPR